MWLFTKYGFYSVVCAREGANSPVIDPDRVMVRARSRAHLDALRQRFPDRLNTSAIHHTPNADYPYRLFVSKALWSTIVAALTEEMDYDNFKLAAATRGDRAYDAMLHEVWDVARTLEYWSRSRWLVRR